MQGAGEVVRLRAQIQAEYEACHNALHGLASGISRHDFINAQMVRMMEHTEALKKLAGEEVAMQALCQLEDHIS